MDPAREAARSAGPLVAWWLGRTPYRDAWELQHRLVAARAAGRIPDQLLLLEHEPVLTLGRHSDPSHVRADSVLLAARGIELVRTERGGEVTYHGPGQLVAYPIVALAERGILVRPYVRALEAALVETCRAFGVEAAALPGSPGCWCHAPGDPPEAPSRKIGAIGVRIERGVAYHGIALNVTVRLADFQLIDACGMPGVESVSIASERGEQGEPTTASVARAAAAFAPALARALGAELDVAGSTSDDPTGARAGIERLVTDADRPALSTAGTGG